jgi:L-Ala-D/L-Glu epimerase / N-acetyl-D-glutamate racemase
MDLSVEGVSYRFRVPVETTFGRLAEREVVRIRVRVGDLAGVGEAAPLPGYDAPTGGLDDALAGLEAAAAAPSLEVALEAAADGPPHARAALDMAAWDLRGQREGRPVAALLSTDPLADVPVNALVSAPDRAGASREAAQAVAAGFRCLKVKVGTGDDAGRLAAVRAVTGPDVAIRIDANGAWTVEEAVAALRALEPIGIELCEEPVHGVEALRAVRERVDVPIAMDETARAPGAAGSGAADAVCLKVGPAGGIDVLMEAAAAARAAGSDVYLASTFDGPTGIAAALHAAAALRVTRPCGLATLALFADVEDPVPPRDGRIAVPASPGLGLTAP